MIDLAKLLLQTSIDELLSASCPSIRFRLQREVLKLSIPDSEGASLREEILHDRFVQEILAVQGPDGWIGDHFHGYDGHEAGMRVLAEKGFRRDEPCLKQAILALESGGERACREMGTVGRVLDSGGFGGILTMQAAAFAQAGMEELPIVQEQVRLALEVLAGIKVYGNVDEIAAEYNGKLVFRNGVRWPGIYHLRLLAFTHSWRTTQNQQEVIQAVEKLVKLSPIPHILVRYKSQLIAPASFAMQNFNANLDSLKDSEWMPWFHCMELLARLGIVNEVPELQFQVERLQKIMLESGGCFKKPLDHGYFKRWGAYTGLMLEQDWRGLRRRMYDLTFRSLLIMKYAASLD